MRALSLACLAAGLSLGVAQQPPLIALNVVRASGWFPGVLWPGEFEFRVAIEAPGAFLRVFNSWNVPVNAFVNDSQIAHELAPNEFSGYCVDACLRHRTYNRVHILDSTTNATLYDGSAGTEFEAGRPRFWDWRNGSLQEVTDYLLYLARFENQDSRILNLQPYGMGRTFVIPQFTPVVGDNWTLQVRRADSRSDDWDSASPINSLVAPFEIITYFHRVTSSDGEFTMRQNTAVTMTGLFQETASYRCAFGHVDDILAERGREKIRWLYSGIQTPDNTTHFQCPPTDWSGAKDGDVFAFLLEERAPGSEAWHAVRNLNDWYAFRFYAPPSNHTLRYIAIAVGGVALLVVLGCLFLFFRRRKSQAADGYRSF